MARVTKAELKARRVLGEDEAQAEMDRLVSAIDEALNAAMKHADIYGLDFHHDPAYGMGGYYIGLSSDDNEVEDDEAIDPDDNYEQNYGWQPSSQSC